MTTKRRRDKGDGALFKNGRGLWVGRITLPPDPTTGKRRTKEVSSKNYDTAFRKLAKMRKDLDHAGNLPTSTPTLGAWLTNTWIPSLTRKRRKPKTIEFYESKARLYIIPTIGNVKLDKISAAHVNKVTDKIITQGLSTTTANGTYRTLALALKDAQALGLVIRNPCDHMTPPPTDDVEREALTAREAIQLLRDTAHLAIFPPLAVALFTGARKGEILGLTTDSIDWDEGILNINESLQRVTWKHGCNPACGRKRGADCPDRTVTFAQGVRATNIRDGLWALRPKSKKSFRAIPMAPVLAATLRKHIDQGQIGPGEHLFRNGAGKVMSPEEFNAQMRAALAEAGHPDLLIHELRHSANTLMDAAGIPEHRRIQIMGHSSAVMTRHYTHAEMATIRAEMETYGAFLEA